VAVQALRSSPITDRLYATLPIGVAVQALRSSPIMERLYATLPI
jgi:hypothetical protein